MNVKNRMSDGRIKYLRVEISKEKKIVDEQMLIVNSEPLDRDKENIYDTGRY